MSAPHSIGIFNVLEMPHAPPQFPGQRVQLIQRPGVTGSSAWLEGSKGDPFNFVTKVDTSGIDTAFDLLATYQAVRGTTNDIVFRGTAIVGCTYLVLAVRALEVLNLPRPVVGGLNSPSLGWLAAEWLLVPIQTS